MTTSTQIPPSTYGRHNVTNRLLGLLLVAAIAAGLAALIANTPDTVTTTSQNEPSVVSVPDWHGNVRRSVAAQ